VCDSQLFWNAEIPEQWSPRYIGNTLGDPHRRAPHGRIWIDNFQGLAGQIILNANNNSVSDPASHADYWKGEVIVGPAAYGVSDPAALILDSAIVLSPDATDPSNLAPFYGVESGKLGGGAAGVAPFRLYNADCFPRNDSLVPAVPPLPATTIVQTDFQAGGTNDAHPVNIRFYGPITKSSGLWNANVRIHCIPLSSQPNTCTTAGWQDITGLLLVRGPGDSNWMDPRSLGLSRASPMMIVGPGIYRVTFTGVKCLGLIGNPVPRPLVFVGDECPEDAYYFRVGQDCPRNGDIAGDDIDDSVQDGVFHCPSGCADFNNSGGISVQDIFDFLTAWFLQCPGPLDPVTGPCFNSADFNRANGITVQDIFDFLAAWFQGNNCQP
jgi:hypothetical protein